MILTLSSELLADLKAKAEAAIKGSRSAEGYVCGRHRVSVELESAANPDTILALIAEIERRDQGLTVPREPTPEMIEAGCIKAQESFTPWTDKSWDSDGTDGASRQGVRQYVTDAYRAMLSAAPPVASLDLEMMEVLRPFVNVTVHSLSNPDDIPDGVEGVVSIKMGDLRRAATLLAKIEGSAEQ